MTDVTIERVHAPTDEIVSGLAELLLDAVADNAGISFMAGLARGEAEAWWRSVLDKATARTVVLIARRDDAIVGTVQLQPAWPPNQPHRADVAKLMVHTRARRGGVARLLMQELERHARAQNFTLLLLDTVREGAAEQLYAGMGWVRVGVVPNFAYNPDGTLCDTVFFYKNL